MVQGCARCDIKIPTVLAREGFSLGTYKLYNRKILVYYDARTMTLLDPHSLDFGKWTRCVQGIAYFHDKGRLNEDITVEKLQELIERGIELKGEGPYDKWAYTMWLLKRIQREVASQTH